MRAAGAGLGPGLAQAIAVADDADDVGMLTVTDRTVLDSQLQDTIYQFEHADGVVGKINRSEGQGSKSEKLAAALEFSTPVIIVTIQTFPHVLKAIEDSVSLKERRYAIIADEAHSSQTGRTANEMKAVLGKQAQGDDDEEVDLSAEDMLTASVQARKASGNLSHYAFTATPKAKTLELFGRVPDPTGPVSKKNKPRPFHIYSMRQAIEEGYILDVLQNYTSYKVAYQLAQKATKPDTEVDAKRAKTKLGQWVKLHDYNIARKVEVIVEHFRGHVADLLGGNAKAMVVTGSRKEAVRYKLGFDKYIQKRGYPGLSAMVAFSGEVEFSTQDPHVEGLLGEKFTETNMNPGLKGRDMRKAFDTPDYTVMIVAQKFQTGFDQPKLCAMYVDKPLGGLECVQTLSRLNRTFPGKDKTYVLDFVNDPDDVLAAFQEYYQTATLLDTSDPDHIWELEEKLKQVGIFTMVLPTANIRVIACARAKAKAPAIAGARCSRRGGRPRFPGRAFRPRGTLLLGEGGSLLGAVRLALELDDLDAVAEAVDHRRDAGRSLEDLVPLGEGFVGGDDRGDLGIVAARDNLVEQVREVAVVPEVSEFIDDEQRRVRIAAKPLGQHRPRQAAERSQHVAGRGVARAHAA